MQETVGKQRDRVDAASTLRRLPFRGNLGLGQIGAGAQNRAERLGPHPDGTKERFLISSAPCCMLLHACIKFLMGGVGGIRSLIARFTDQHADRFRRGQIPY